MSSQIVGDWLLVVVEGPSEAKDDVPGGERRGVVIKILEEVFGRECAQGATIRYWRYVKRSPLRGEEGLARRGFAAKASYFARLGEATAYGTVLLIDNDNDVQQDRLAELTHGVESVGLRERTAVGVARQMLESWLLADEHLLVTALPAGKSSEELWGSKKDGSSNYPKHVLRRCILEPKGWEHWQAIENWEPGRARTSSGSLGAFSGEIEELARRQGVS